MTIRTRCLALAAVAAVLVAGAVLHNRRGTRATGSAPVANQAPTVVATASPPALLGRSPATDAATVAARAYSLAATNWSPGTYASQRGVRARMATGALRRELLRRSSVDAQVAQLGRDRVSRLGAVLRVRVASSSAGTARVLVDVDELRLSAGRRSRGAVRYRLRLREVLGGWRVVAFTATGDAS